MSVEVGYNELFNQFRDSILRVDPVYFCSKYLTVDGNPLKLEGTGYKPFADIYRYIALKAIDKNSKPIVLVKGRQVGATVMAGALECYFSACGLFGTNERPPMRMMHLFPTLSLAAAYTKDKLDPLISLSAPVPGAMKSNGILKSYMEARLDLSSPTNNNMHFKRFINGNQVWIESTGLDGDRVRGRQLCLDTELPTPDRGFIKLRDLKEGDKLFDENGDICNVTKLHPIQKSPESYRITFDDGTIVDACAEHLWLTYTENKPSVKNTKEILNTFGKIHYIPTCINLTKNTTEYRFIKSIELINPKPMRCITVDSPSHLYLITRSFIATHNTVDACFFDECFPYEQYIETISGKVKIGDLYNLWKTNKQLPLVKTYNEKNETFEYKKIIKAWERGERELILVKLGNRKIRCTPNHKLLTVRGWVRADELIVGDLVLATSSDLGQINKQLNDDQLQIVLGSFLGDGFLSNHGLNQYRLVENHGLKQTKYCEWKASMFGVSTTLIEKNGFSQKPCVRFSTNLFALPWKFTKKISCPQFVLDNLDARGLAIWFMDDGTKGGVISTCSFDEDSQIRIVEKLQSMGIDCEYRWYPVKGKKSSGYFSIYLTKNGYNKLNEIVFPYIHESLQYKFTNIQSIESYNWNPIFKEAGLIAVKEISNIIGKKKVYDIEVEDNHNFIATSVKHAKNTGGIIVHNCQDMSDTAIGAAKQILTKSRYGTPTQGIQVYYGTPKTKGGSYWNMWQKSSQNYFHLRCEKCGKYFPLYHPSIEWESVWIYGLTVRCTECHHEQDKLEAQERGKWIPLNPPEECDLVGYHINQLYIPDITREVIDRSKPERSPTNTERIYMNEILGEFYDGEGGTITAQEIRDKCIDKGRRMAKFIYPESGKRTYAGFDWGQRGALDQIAGRGRKGSYSCAVILTVSNGIFNIEFATRLNRPDPETKIGTVEEMFRRYNMSLSVGDIGDAYDLTHKLQRIYDERFLASRASHKVNGHVKYSNDEWPKTIVFEKDYYISELLGLLKDGKIKFPGGSFDRIEWLIEHCASMDIKVTRDKSGESLKKYVKGSGANDGLMALLNAYLAWKFDVTQGFTISNPLHMKYEMAAEVRPIQAVVGYIPKMFGGR